MLVRGEEGDVVRPETPLHVREDERQGLAAERNPVPLRRGVVLEQTTPALWHRGPWDGSTRVAGLQLTTLDYMERERSCGLLRTQAFVGLCLRILVDVGEGEGGVVVGAGPKGL